MFKYSVQSFKLYYSHYFSRPSKLPAARCLSSATPAENPVILRLFISLLGTRSGQQYIFKMALDIKT